MSKKKITAPQLRCIRNWMVGGGGWCTLGEVSLFTGAPEASASAQFRALRKLGYKVAKKINAMYYFDQSPYMYLYRITKSTSGVSV